jgi:phage shock protein PspC (stress-responsive transcriptional regulator)
MRVFPGAAAPVGARGWPGTVAAGSIGAMTAPVPPRAGIRRSRSGAVLGGVCAGVARSAGLDPLLLRIALVAVTVLTGGAGLLAYLAAWVLIPRESETPAAIPAGDGAAPAADARTAWSAAGRELRSLADELRRPQSAPAAQAAAEDPSAAASPAASTGDAPTTAAPGAPSRDDAPTEETEVPTAAVPPPRSPLAAADDAATALGERLRAPEVQAGARRAATSVSQALAASVDEVGRRVRRDRT